MVNVPTRFQRGVVSALNQTTLQVESPTATSSQSTFTFDRVMGPSEGQAEVYECVENLVTSFLSGINSTILGEWIYEPTFLRFLSLGSLSQLWLTLDWH